MGIACVGGGPAGRKRPYRVLPRGDDRGSAAGHRSHRGLDGVNSRIWEEARGIHTDVHVGDNKYIWLGTDKVLDSFMFPFARTDSGWIWAHAYGVDPDSSTFIVECSTETWGGLGPFERPMVREYP